MARIRFFLVSIIIISFFFGSCEKDQDEISVASEDSVYLFVDEVMKYWYLWNEEVPDLDIYSYNEPGELLEDLKYKPVDKWSFIDKTEDVLALFEQGQTLSFGFYMGWNQINQLWVIISYPNSEAYKSGIRRGCQLLEIDDTPVIQISSFDSFFDNTLVTMKFKFIDLSGTTQEISLTKEEVTMSGILYQDIYQVSGKKTGYMVYDSFLEYSEEELIETMQYFKNEEIEELIIDLRYNSGGLVSLTEDLAEMIIPQDAVGKVFYERQHNSARAAENNTFYYLQEHPLNLNLDRVFFITTSMSASASELIINGLEPHMEVITIGERTSGKPVGMYGFEFQDWMMFPITNLAINADGYGEYYDGLPVDKQESDGYEYSWGSETEPCLNQAFHYISYGTFDDAVAMDFKSAEDMRISENIPQKRNLLIFRN